MKKKRILLKKWSVILVAALFLLIMIIFSLLDFNVFTEEKIEEELHSYMDDIREQSAFTLRNSMGFLTERLETESHSFSAFGRMSEQEIIDELAHFANRENVDRATIVTPDGTVYSSDFGKQTIDPAPYEEAFARDETFINKPRFFEPTEQQFIDISTPVYIDGEKFGSLSISYDQTNLEEIFRVAFLDGDCTIHLIAGDGTLIGRIGAAGEQSIFKENIFTLPDGDDTSQSIIEGSFEEFKSNFENGIGGWLRYKDGKETHCASYAPAGVEDWVLVTVTDGELVKIRAEGLETMAGVLTIKIIVIMALAILLFGIYYFNERSKLRQMRNSYCLALRKSNDIFFEVDLKNDRYINHSESMSIRSKSVAGESFSDFIRRSSKLCPIDDRQDFLNRFLPEHLKTIAGEAEVPYNFEYKIVNEQGVGSWFRSTVIPVLENEKEVQTVICIDKDITEEKRSNDELRNAAKLDGLTLLYNKVAAHEIIEDFLQSDGKDGNHALFMIDIDGFKEINDRYGHAKGDEVIEEFGRVLTGIFRKSDILGRDGGDEFIAFLKDYKDIELIISKAEQVNKRLKKLLLDGDGVIIQVSASIGIAVCPRDGSGFDELYKGADTAMYASKSTGKSKYTFF